MYYGYDRTVRYDSLRYAQLDNIVSYTTLSEAIRDS